MKKVFFTMMLAMVSSVWMMNEASNWCMPSVRTLTEPWIEVNGTFQAEGLPCEPDELCPPCLTIVLVTSDKTYYLVTDDGQLIEQLDTIPLGTKATVSGTPFTHGNYNYIQVSKIDLVALTEFQEQLLGMWQVYKQDVTDVYWDEEGVPSRETRTFNIDTEETCARIWHIEAKHIYEAGPCIDIRYPLPTYTLTELEDGMWRLTIPELYDLFVNDTTEAPSGTTPIIIHKLDENNMEWEYSIYGGDEGPTTYYQYLWRVGTQDNDTLPLYIKDGAGTSTVEPVDPNQIVATLVGDMLSIYEYIGAEIGYKVSKASPGNNMPARGKEMADDTFSESVSIQLKESGLYTLELTNPEWGYTIVGTFEYDGMQGIEPVETGVPAAQKTLRNGQLFIRKGDRMYTVQGIEIRE